MRSRSAAADSSVKLPIVWSAADRSVQGQALDSSSSRYHGAGAAAESCGGGTCSAHSAHRPATVHATHVHATHAEGIRHSASDGRSHPGCPRRAVRPRPASTVPASTGRSGDTDSDARFHRTAHLGSARLGSARHTVSPDTAHTAHCASATDDPGTGITDAAGRSVAAVAATYARARRAHGALRCAHASIRDHSAAQPIVDAGGVVTNRSSHSPGSAAPRTAAETACGGRRGSGSDADARHVSCRRTDAGTPRG